MDMIQNGLIYSWATFENKHVKYNVPKIGGLVCSLYEEWKNSPFTHTKEDCELTQRDKRTQVSNFYGPNFKFFCHSIPR